MLDRLFARLREIIDHGPGGLARDEDNENPLGLSDGEMKTLRGFKDSAEYEVFLTVVDRTTTLYAENLLNCDREKLPDIRGIIAGLRMSGTLIETITSQEDDLHARQRARQAEERARNLDAATFGTPARRSFGNGRNRE